MEHIKLILKSIPDAPLSDTDAAFMTTDITNAEELHAYLTKRTNQGLQKS